VDIETQEKIVTGLVEAVRAVGADDYEAAMMKAKKIIGKVYDAIESMETIQKLRAAMDSADSLNPEDTAIAEFTVGVLPQLIRMALESGGKTLAADLPMHCPGRPRALKEEEHEEILDFILDLFRKKVPLTTAKLRASQRFGCSKRTIDRLWANRKSVPARGFKFDDAVKWLTT
jgi:hypothetical protein